MMLTEDAKKIFGSLYRISKLLHLHPSAPYQWGDKIPRLREYQLREMIDKAFLKNSDLETASAL